MLAVLLLAGIQQPAPQAGTDIVVVARQQRCSVQLGKTLLSRRQLDHYAKLWGDHEEVRISVAPGASYKCLAKIMFRLADRGVTHAYFVDQPPVQPAGDPAAKP